MTTSKSLFGSTSSSNNSSKSHLERVDDNLISGSQHYKEREEQQDDLNDDEQPIIMVQSPSTTTTSMLSSSLNCLLLKDGDNDYYDDDGEEQQHPTNDQQQHERLHCVATLPTIMDILSHQQEKIVEKEQEKKVNGGLIAYWDSFTHSQFYVHLLMFSTLLTFGGFCVLAPNPIRTMRPTIFAFVRSFSMVVCYFVLSLIVDRDYSFRSDRFLARIKNPILRYLYRKTPCFRDFKRMVLCGSMYMLNMVLFVLGMKMVNATIAAIVQPLVAVGMFIM